MKQKMNIRTTITETIVILFIILFLYTGISKLMDYSVFKEQIAVSPILHPVAPIIAGTLPWMEFIVATLLVIPRWRLKGLYVSLALMISFTLYIIYMLLFYKDLPCSCGGVIQLLSWDQHIIFNGLFILLALTGVLLEKGIQIQNKKALASILK